MKRELKFLLSYKRLLIIILIIPILFSSFYAYLYQGNIVNHLKVGIIDYKPSGISRQIVNGFEKSSKFEVEMLSSEEEIIPLMEQDKIDGVIILPADFTKNIKSGRQSSVFASANGTNLLISNNFMVGALEIINTFDTGIVIKNVASKGALNSIAYAEAMPISLSLHPWYNPTTGYANFFLPGLIVFIVQQATFLVVAITITNERKNNTLKLLTQSYHTFGIISGKILTYTMLSIISCFSSIYVVFKYFNMPIYGSLLSIGSLTLAFSLCICTMGMFLSIICNKSLDSIQYSMLIALPSFLLSGYTWPMQAMPDYLAFVGKLLPLTYIANNLRKLSLMGVDYSLIKEDIGTLLLMTCIFLILSLVIFWWKFKRVKVNKKESITA
ncbi:ABC transporter permease [Desulfonispora thiosulfatigenes]|nr:ABC transporter permease [Desulfonispora thiosulfatigenes]